MDGVPPDAGEYWAKFVSDRARRVSNLNFSQNRVEVNVHSLCVNILS